jgi:hypothetical protein
VLEVIVCQQFLDTGSVHDGTVSVTEHIGAGSGVIAPLVIEFASVGVTGQLINYTLHNV